MSRFQLVIREPGKDPRIVGLGQAIVVGRSKKAGLTIADEEVGREQFRIGVEHAMVVIEGIGRTNRTTIDGVPLGAGERTVVASGSTIRVGRTSFELRDGEVTDGSTGRPDDQERTMLAPNPLDARRAPAAEKPPDPQEGTGGFVGPMQTMEVKGPGGPRAAAGKGAAKPTPPPAPPKAGQNLDEQTMQMGGGYRPGAAKPGQPAPAPKGNKPEPAPPVRPSPPPTAPPPVVPASPTPPAAPPPPVVQASSPPVVEPPPAKTPPAREKVKTVALSTDQMAPPPLVGPTPPTADAGPDVESRLHAQVPRLLVKGEGIKRRMRVMKAVSKIGRAETADILLAHESVSEMHAEIRFDGTTWFARDCGSTNGTFVDGVQLRGTEQTLQRHSLLGLGSVRAVFLCNEGGNADGRLEDRALRLLVNAGRLTKEEGRQLQQMARAEGSQSIAEVLLLETSLGPADWAQAVASVRSQASVLERVGKWFSRRRPNQAP